jgi:small subunit ribosomal protein S1
LFKLRPGPGRRGGICDAGLEREVLEAFTDGQTGQPVDLDSLFRGEGLDFRAGTVVRGRVTGIVGDSAVVDIGYKSAGTIPLGEWSEDRSGGAPSVGDCLDVLLDSIEGDSGSVVLSRRKALALRAWQAALARHPVGSVVSGVVSRRVWGGLLVDIGGLHAILPASQIGLRRPPDLDAHVGQSVECRVTHIDHERRRIVLSRRELLEEQRRRRKEALLAELAPGQVRQGVVGNVTPFGAFIDLGGLDGLLHRSDMAWHRVGDPGEVVRVGQHLEVLVLDVDLDRGRVALGLKQLRPGPWAGVADRYPVGSRHRGEVVNVVRYGAFVRLEPGVEGLLHVSELPDREVGSSEGVVQAGDEIEVRVLRVDAAGRKISLSRRGLS